jgi:DNA polymerase-3 subunit delta'
MKFSAYLEKNQPLVYRTFSSAKAKEHLAHAYLLSGESGTPLKETAYFLAKSILCDKPNPLACEECITCQRVQNGNYADLLFLDGSEGSIKKEEVEAIVASFSKTAIERKGIMIYIINLVENMTTEAVNALLKFLEEPTKNTYAFLTTENEARVLPTIVSRCETLRMVLRPRQEVIAEAQNEGISLQDAEILSYFSNSAELIREEAQSEDYAGAKAAFDLALDALKEPRSTIIFSFEKNLIPTLKSKENARYFLDMLSLAYKDLIAIKEGQDIVLTTYGTLLRPLAKTLPHPTESLLEILKVRGQIDLNISLDSLFEHLAQELTKEY